MLRIPAIAPDESTVLALLDRGVWVHPGYFFGMPDFGSNFMAFNYHDATGHFGSIVSQLYFRQVMAHLQDQEGYITAFMHGAGDQSYGPIPTYPKSPYVPQDGPPRKL